MINQVVEYLKGLEGKTLVLTHHNADIDAGASAISLKLGLEKLGKEVDIGVAESVSRAARGFCGKYKFIVDPDCSKFDNVILVDTSVPEQLSSVGNLRADCVIDHHPKGKLVGELAWVDETKKSAAQMVYEVLKKLEVDVDHELAKIIACGIVGDTAHLRLAEKEEFSILVELLHTGVTYSEILKSLESKIEVSERVACLKACTRADVYRNGEVIVVISKVVSFEAAACRALLRSGADVAVVIANKKDQMRVSSRGNYRLKGKIDLSEIFAGVGKIIGGSGGGHDLAGSANGKDRKEKEVRDFLIVELSKRFGKLERI
jgi:bifunctional oligoribonuclease and PAP phosphatase NrnA